MPDDVYSPPVLHLYYDDLIADTTDLTPEELGVYMRLMHRQWKTGAIPADIGKQASIGGVARPRMKRIREAIGDRLKSHPSTAAAVFSPRMEEVREQQRLNAITNSARGKNGAKKRWELERSRNAQALPEQGDGIARGMREGMLGDSIPISDLHDPSASPRDSAGARTRESALASPAYALCLWLLREGIQRGVIPADRGADEFAWCYRNLEDGEKLIEFYGDAESRRRSERMFAMKARRALRRDVTPRTLLDIWDWDQIRGGSDDGPSFDEMMGVA